MGRCPFLSTKNEKVDCFKECVFYEQNEEECPFKKIYDGYDSVYNEEEHEDMNLFKYINGKIMDI